MTELHSCVEVHPPGESFESGAGKAAIGVTGSRNELALARDRKWQVGQELRIRFLDGDARGRSLVERYARTWLEYANLRFVFGDHANAELRITFTGSGNWSYIGTAAQRIHPTEPTMQLGGLADVNPPDLARRFVLHEFGHALGCVHEHSSPVAEIPWDESAVYAHYRSSGWDDDQIRHNVLHRESPMETDFSSYDPDSIMQYPVPAELTTGGFEIPWNTDLSAGDKNFIAQLYPFREE
ncbi:zinc metalloprotease [Nocardia bovistercoris]|uniref:Peptidase metallopeptidase domain-containing protein n=1 Tax=Nocardia bovistercoris TaxID=2785916 RepID=A0A931I6I8_9NOCA|nr:Tolloid-like protein 1 [Nocardia bovistercoris]MBH0775006.1 hypothetical protein [Nocardia bovistercoris]